MATTLQIRIELDEKGLVTGLQRIGTAVDGTGQQFTNLGQTGHQAFDRMSNDWEKAHVAQILAARTIGVEIPRALESMMLQSQSAMKVFGALFSASTAVLFVQGLASILPKLGELSDWAVGYTDQLKDVQKDAKAASDQALVSPKNLEDAQKVSKLFADTQKKLQDSTQLTAEEEVLQVAAMGDMVPIMGAYATEQGVVAGYVDETLTAQERITALGLQNNQTLEQTARLNQQIASYVLQQQNAAEMAGKKGIAAQLQEFEYQKKLIMKSFPAGTPVSDPGVQKEFVAAFQARSDTMTAMARDEAQAQIEAQAKATASTLLGMDQIRAKRAEELRETQVLLQENVINEQQASARNVTTYREAASAEVVLRRTAEDQIRELRDQTNAIGLEGAAKVLEEQRKADEDSMIAYSRSIITKQELDDQLWEHQRASIKNMLVLERQYHEQSIAAQQQADLAGLQGFARISEEESQAVENAQRKFRDEFGALPTTDPLYINAARDLESQLNSIHREGLAQRQQDTRQNTEATIEAEQRAAVASLPPWQRADAQIAVDYDTTMRKIQQDLDQHVIGEEDAQRRRNAAWVDANARIADNWRQTRDQLANDLESLFTGDIGKNILNQVQHFFFQILASWLMTLGDMRQVAGQGGGLLGGILGSITGMNGGKSGGLQLPGGVQPTFAGAAGSSSQGGGAGAAVMLSGKAPQAAVIGATFASPLPVIVTNTPLLVSGSLGIGGGGTPDLLGTGGVLQEPGLYGNIYPGATTGGVLQEPGLYGNIYTGPAGEPVAGTTAMGGTPLTPPGYTPPDLLGLPIPANWPGGTGAQTSSIPPIVLSGPLGAGLPSAGVGIPSATMREAAVGAGISMVGAKFGGTAGSIGGLIGMLGLAAKANPSGGAAALLNFFGIGPGVAAGLSGGLIGFGIGQQTGSKGLGALGGAGSGAVLGFMFGGPVGAIIGGLAGLIGGIFGGILGGAQKKKQAENYAATQVEPAISKLIDAYNARGTQYADAMAQLLDLSNQAWQAMAAIGSQGKDVFQARVTPDIQKAVQQIQQTEDERQRRESMTFGPPQFQHGGYIAPELPRTATGGVLAELHPYEFVSTAAATALHRPQLEAWNAEAAGDPTSALMHSQYVLSAGTRNSALPQFERGGFVSGELAGFRLSSGDVMATLQRGAAASTSPVPSPSLTARTNGGASVHLSVAIQAWDGESVDRWLRNGGDRKLEQAVRRSWREYSGGGDDIGG